MANDLGRATFCFLILSDMQARQFLLVFALSCWDLPSNWRGKITLWQLPVPLCVSLQVFCTSFPQHSYEGSLCLTNLLSEDRLAPSCLLHLTSLFSLLSSLLLG